MPCQLVGRLVFWTGTSFFSFPYLLIWLTLDPNLLCHVRVCSEHPSRQSVTLFHADMQCKLNNSSSPKHLRNPFLFYSWMQKVKNRIFARDFLKYIMLHDYEWSSARARGK